MSATAETAETVEAMAGEDGGGLAERLRPLLAEAVLLRTEAPPLLAEASPQELLTALAELRARLDRVEAILRGVIRVRAQAKRVVDGLDAQLIEEWDQALMRVRASGVRREYEGARERYAETNLATLPLRRRVREAQHTLSVAEEALELLRFLHRGLDSHRADLHVMVRALTVERSLDR